MSKKSCGSSGKRGSAILRMKNERVCYDSQPIMICQSDASCLHVSRWLAGHDWTAKQELHSHEQNEELQSSGQMRKHLVLRMESGGL